MDPNGLWVLVIGVDGTATATGRISKGRQLVFDGKDWGILSYASFGGGIAYPTAGVSLVVGGSWNAKQSVILKGYQAVSVGQKTFLVILSGWMEHLGKLRMEEVYQNTL